MKLIYVKITKGDSGCLSNMGSEQIGFEQDFEVSIKIKHDFPLPVPNNDTDTSVESKDYKYIQRIITSNLFKVDITELFNTYMEQMK